MLLSIEKLIYGGDGLAHLPADASGRGKAVFVPFVLSGEKVDAAISEQKAGFARAKLERIVEPSPHRIQRGCPYFGSCGGCHYQHASYDHQIEIKKQVLRETIERTAKIELPVEIEVHPSPPWNYRNRSRLQLQTRPDFAIGYYKMSSHELLPVEQCPISSPLINRGIAMMWEMGRKGRVPGGAAEIEFFANADDSELLLELSCTADARRSAVRECAEEMQAALPEIRGIAGFRKSGSGTEDRLLNLGEGHLTYKTPKSAYRVSAGSFFQTNRHLTDELVKIVTSGQSGELALDLYAGVGLFSTALACDFRHIFSVESSQTSAGDLAYNLPSNGEAIRATTEQYLARAENAKSGKGIAQSGKTETPSLVIVDPPRSGLGERVARRLAISGAPRVVYVSCDPATLARDLGAFLSSGYRIDHAHLVDLFPQTFHIETVVHLVR
ncbi:MAG TPA: 23S rRNA (uracil(1939)-C(5))-methyltransferase RlmD [Candidatus Sulfotelmatobacter sp.]